MFGNFVLSAIVQKLLRLEQTGYQARDLKTQITLSWYAVKKEGP